MDDDLVKILREQVKLTTWPDAQLAMEAAADRIEAQAAEIDRLQLECQAQYDRGYYDGRQFDGAEERAKIVAWIERRYASTISENIVQCIEAEEHLK